MELTESGRSWKLTLRVLLLIVCLVNLIIAASYYSTDAYNLTQSDISKEYLIEEVKKELTTKPAQTTTLIPEKQKIKPLVRKISGPNNKGKIPKENINHSKGKNSICPEGLIVSVECGGRLGNRIFEYGTAWALAKMLNRTVYAPEKILESLTPIFVNFQSKTSLEKMMKTCNISKKQLQLVKDIRPIEEFAAKYPSQHVLLRMYIDEHEMVYPYIKEFREEFRFRQEILDDAKNTIAQAGGAGKTLISIHVRRTDFAKYLPRRHNTNLTDATYFKNAMQWYRERLEGPLLFLVVSDDVKWCRKSFADETDVKIVSKDPGHDLAVMSLCNYAIIDYGTFGYSGAYFSNGTAITLDVSKAFASYMAKHAGWTVFSKTTLKETEAT